MRYSIGAKGRANYIKGAKRLLEIYAPQSTDHLLLDEEKRERLSDKFHLWQHKYRIALDSQVIVFDCEQIKVFWELICKGEFSPALDYKLPFENTWIQFSDAVVLDRDDTEAWPDLGNTAILLTQQDSGFNQIVLIHEEHDDELLAWNSSNLEDVSELGVVHGATVAERYRLLAAACVAYINCENIYLQKEGEVSEAINAKRQRKGKSKLEPYYVCRIRGVQYDSNGYEKGAGIKHGIRYDVRGHFRHLDTGKTIWVRPHQRGLQNELYVPKTYVVARQPQP